MVTPFSKSSATVVGYGAMGREFVKALQVLNVASIQICSRSKPQFETVSGNSAVQTFVGGYQQFLQKARPGELAIVATPTADLIPAVRCLRGLGFKKFLIEKPVSLYSKEIEKLQRDFETPEIEIRVGYNRVAYPSFLAARHWAEEEGGITSCFYTLTEIIGKDWIERFPKEELARWGIANSLHVASLAHGLIGLPKAAEVFQGGGDIAWHPAGSIFVGSGISEKGIPFSYHADWTSTGRWSVEFHTRKASYLLCPLEKLYRRTSFKEPWQEVPVDVFSDRVKSGIVEEVAAMLEPEWRSKISLYSLEDTLKLTQFGEKVFGYDR